jgi:DNA-binding SARP family transcriptional activator
MTGASARPFLVDLREPAPRAAWRPPGVPASYALSLLGEFSLAAGDGTITLPVASQRLVALLALQGRASRSRIAGTLWPQSSEERALASLRTVIWRLNHCAVGVVLTTGGPVCLGPTVHVDVQRFLEAAAALMRSQASGSDWSGMTDVEVELLPGWSEEWLIAPRERLRQLQLHVLEAVAEELARRGRYGLALDAALAAVRADPLRESAHRAVIRVHVAEGNLVEAVRAYQECRLLLQRELGVDPRPETARMVHQLRGAGAPVTPAPPVARPVR